MRYQRRRTIVKASTVPTDANDITRASLVLPVEAFDSLVSPMTTARDVDADDDDDALIFVNDTAADVCYND